MVIRIKGVKRVVSKGRVYYYHRKSGLRLPGVPGTTIFADALKAAENGAVMADGIPGTLGGIIAAYRAAPEFTGLQERTRADYQKVFDYLKPLGVLPIGEVDRAYLYEVRDKAFKRRKRRFANYVTQVLSRVFNWAKRRNMADDNPAADVEPIKRPKDAPIVNRAWTDDELATVLAAAPLELRVAIALGAYLGFRVGDMLRLTWSAYDGLAFQIRQHKTGEELWVPVHRHLKTILDAHKERRRSPVIVIGAKGKPFTVSGFQTRFFGMLRRLRKEGKVAKGLSFHGLRHTVGRKLGEAGCAARTIADMLGQKTTAMGEHYSRHANRKHLVREAVTALERNSAENGKPNGKPPVDRFAK